MKLSTRSRYGSRALLEIAYRYGERPVKRKEISRKHRISKGYLENILIALKGTGILTTLRGANGGYSLARHPSAITLLDVAQALEGSLSVVDCLDNAAICRQSGRCATQDAWRQIKDAQEKVLAKITIEDLVRKDRKYHAISDNSRQRRPVLSAGVNNPPVKRMALIERLQMALPEKIPSAPTRLACQAAVLRKAGRRLMPP
jgi:Rrf2 family protein